MNLRPAAAARNGNGRRPVEAPSRRKCFAAPLSDTLLEPLDLASECVDRLVDRLLEGAGAVFGHHLLARDVERDGGWRPAYWAISVPNATPSTFIPSTNTKHRLATIFTIFCAIAINIGKREFCIPINQPAKPYNPNTAGAPQIQILK